MTQLKNTLVGFALAVAVIAASYGVGYLTAHRIWKTRWDNRPTIAVKTDTLTLHDTLRLPAPKPDVVKIRDTVKLLFTDTVFVAATDSSASLVRTSVDYRDSTFFATVSGVLPSLDYIEVYQKTRIVTNTVAELKEVSRWSFSACVGPTVGYGFTPKGAQPFCGAGLTVGIAYRF